MEMEPWEVNAVVNAQLNDKKEAWERARFISYIGALPHSKKGLKPTDIIKFAWEKDKVEKLNVPNKEDIERMRKKFK